MTYFNRIESRSSGVRLVSEADQIISGGMSRSGTLTVNNIKSAIALAREIIEGGASLLTMIFSPMPDVPMSKYILNIINGLGLDRSTTFDCVNLFIVTFCNNSQLLSKEGFDSLSMRLSDITIPHEEWFDFLDSLFDLLVTKANISRSHLTNIKSLLIVEVSKNPTTTNVADLFAMLDKCILNYQASIEYVDNFKFEYIPPTQSAYEQGIGAQESKGPLISIAWELFDNDLDVRELKERACQAIENIVGGMILGAYIEESFYREVLIQLFRLQNIQNNSLKFLDMNLDEYGLALGSIGSASVPRAFIDKFNIIMSKILYKYFGSFAHINSEGKLIANEGQSNSLIDAFYDSEDLFIDIFTEILFATILSFSDLTKLLERVSKDYSRSAIMTGSRHYEYLMRKSTTPGRVFLRQNFDGTNRNSDPFAGCLETILQEGDQKINVFQGMPPKETEWPGQNKSPFILFTNITES